MDQPPNPSQPSEPDTPKPPIWEQQAAASRPAVPHPAIRPDGQPIIPDTAAVIPPPAPSAPLAAPNLPVAPGAPTPPVAPVVPEWSSPQRPPTSTGLAPTFDKPRWPTEPPTVGNQTDHHLPGERATTHRRKVGLVVTALLALAAFAALAFFVGRSVGTTETAITTPILDTTTTESIPLTEPEEPAATAPPVPTVIPEPLAAPQVNPVPDDAEEPVAAAAAAVAPAVVLITNELGQGSGIIYDESGLLLTNAHVVGQFSAVRVQLASGVTVAGEVLGADARTDVAVVRITTDEEFGVAVLAPQESIEVGQLAIAIGSPFGLEQTVTSGVVSAVGRVVEDRDETGAIVSAVAMIQTDAPINPGNSGGALADRQGRVIGMNTSIRTDGSGGNIGVGFAIPSDTAKLIADRILNGESLEQGFLGINGETPILGTPGAKVVAVTPGSGAATAGIIQDDLITEFNGRAIRSMIDLAAEVRLQAPDATVSVTIQRDGQTLELEVVLGLLTATG